MYPDWVEKHRASGREIKKSGNNYYLYEYKTVYDKKKKGPKKLSGSYIGKITKEGLVPAKHRLKKIDDEVPKVSSPLEYGASYLLELLGKDMLDNLKTYFPDDAETIFSLGKQYFIDPQPLKRRKIVYDSSFDSILHPNLSISPSSLSSFLDKLGKDRENQVNFMKQYLDKSEYVIFDGTRLVSYSENMDMAKVGYNHCGIEDPQVNLLYCFSLFPDKAPVYFRANAGDKSDYDTILNTIEETGIEKIVMIADKGFCSDFNIQFFKGKKLNYIIPLRRNSKEIDYSKVDTSKYSSFDGHFGYRGRVIFYKILSEHKIVEQEEEVKKRGRKPKNPKVEYKVEKIEKDMMVLFYDEQMKHIEFRDYGRRLLRHNDKYSVEGLEEIQSSMGTLTLISNLEIEPEKLYTTYKEREIIEDSNKAYKNVLKVDESYLRDDIKYNGWLFLNHISLMLYYRIFNRIKEAKKTGVLSVEDVITILKRTTRQKINDKWIIETATKVDNKKIIEVFPEIEEILPKYNT